MKKISLLIASLLIVAAACGSSGGTGTGGQTTTSSTTSAPLGGSGGGPTGTKLCNPFTGAPCDLASGETCDWSGINFICFPPPNDGKLCEPCGDPDDGGVGVFCGVGLTCYANGQCAALCCDDGDCGPGGACDLTFLLDTTVGVCVASGAGGSGGGSAAGPACSAPASAPSQGSCYKP